MNACVWVMIASGVPFFFPPVSCLSLLYTLHHNLVEGTGSCILNHFYCPWGLCLLVSWGFVLWWCFPWSYLYPILTTYVFDTFCCSFGILDDYLSNAFLCCPVVGCGVGLVVVVEVPLFSPLVLLLLLFMLPVSSQLLLRTLFCTLLIAHCGYLQLPRAPLRCFSSSSRSSGVV